MHTLFQKWGCYGLLVGVVALFATHSAWAGDVIISEFMAINDTSILDEDGDDSDWIEIANTGTGAVDLTGWYLTDEVAKPDKWMFPAIVLEAGTERIVFASNKDRRDPAAELHTNFKLSSDGEYLALVRPDETVEQAYTPAYPPQFPDVSYGVATVGAETVALIGPGAPATYSVPTGDSQDVNNPAASPPWNDPAFDDSGWASTDLAVGYTTDGNQDYGLFIGTNGNVQALMYNLYPSAYTRVPFTVEDPARVASLTLWLRYDDGFAAYINGGTNSVAGANNPADGALAYDSTATATHPDGDAMDLIPFVIDLSGIHLEAGANLLAIHGLNRPAGSSDFLVDVELEAVIVPTGASEERVYMMTATPGAPNAGGVQDLGPIFRAVTDVAPAVRVPDETGIVVAAEVEASNAPVSTVRLVYRRMFETEQTVEMRDDGVLPDAHAGDGVFTATVPLAGLSVGEMIRWRFEAEDTDTTVSRSPLFHDPLESAEYFGTLAEDLSITSELPVIHWFVANESAANTRTGTRASAWFRGEFYDNFFVRIRGGSTAGFPKKSYKFDFNPRAHFRFDPDAGRAEEINLNQTWSDKAYLRQALSFAVYDQCGSPGSESFLVRLHRNGAFHAIQAFVEQPDKRLLKREGLDDRGALYKMFNAVTSGTSGVEKKNRTHENHSDLTAFVNGVNGSSGAALDTFIFDQVDIPRQLNYLVATVLSQNNDNMKKNFYLYRDSDGSGEWFQVPWDTDLTWGSHFMTANSSAHDGIWADKDYHEYDTNGNYISPSHPFVGTDELQGNRSWNHLIDQLYANPRFAEMFRRRLRTMMDEVFAPPHLDNLIAEWQAGFTVDAEEDRLKWGQFGTSQTLAQAIAILVNDYLQPKRTHLFVTHDAEQVANYPGYPVAAVVSAELPGAQAVDAVVSITGLEYNPVSGNQDEEYICITNANAFAVDVSEWKLTGGVSHKIRPGTVIPARDALYLTPASRAFRSRTQGPSGGMGLLVQGGVNGHLQARGEQLALTDTAGRLVSAFQYAGNPSPAQQWLRITEVMYNPSPMPAVADDPQAFEYIELRNTSSAISLDLDGVHFSQGVSFDFSGSAVTTLAPDAYVLVVRDPVAFTARYGSSVPIAGTYTGALDNGGESLRLDDATGEKILEFTYKPGWFPVTDGLGFSLVIIDDRAPWTTWGDSSSWRVSGVLGGSPGDGDLPHGLAPIHVNEVLAHTDLPLVDTVELYNPLSGAVDIGGWFITDDPAVPKKVRLVAGTMISGGGFLTLTESLFNTGPDAFLLSEHGDAAYLFSGDAAGNLTGYAHGHLFHVSPNGVSFGRHVDSLGRDHFVLQSARSLDVGNALPLVGPVVITEIMYHPPDPAYGIDNDLDEFIELRNISDRDIPLYCTYTNQPGVGVAAEDYTWQLRNAVDYDFPPQITLPVGGRLIVVGFDPVTDPVQLGDFRSRYGLDPGVPVFGPWSGKLDNSDEEIELKRPDVPEFVETVFVPYVMVDQVHYRQAAPWAGGADGLGQSLQRRVWSVFGNDPINWRAGYPQGAHAPDTDVDGMADAWEERHGLVVGTDDSGEDPDGDGAVNGMEETAGTDPRDPGSVLRLNVVNQAVGFALGFSAVGGIDYTVQATDSLRATGWQTWQHVPARATNHTVVIEEQAPHPGTRSFRVVTPAMP